MSAVVVVVMMMMRKGRGCSNTNCKTNACAHRCTREDRAAAATAVMVMMVVVMMVNLQG